MMEELIPTLLEQGGMFAIAVLALYTLNAVWKARQTELVARLKEERQDKLRLADVLDRNTQAITELSTTVKEMKQIVQNQYWYSHRNPPEKP